MTFFRIENDNTIRNRWFLSTPRTTADGDRFDFWPLVSGECLLPIKKPIRFEIKHVGAALDFTLAGFDVPVVKSELMDAIARLDRNGAARVPAAIQDWPGGYEILVIQRLVSCVDEGRSRVTRWHEGDGRPEKVGQYRMIANLSIDYSKVPKGCDIFRIEGWEVAMVVSARMRTAMEAVGCRGVVFQEL